GVVQKLGNEQVGGKAVIIAYYGLFALFPLLLLFTTIIGDQLRSASRPLTGSAWAVTIGVLGTLYGAQGVGQAALNAMLTVWNTSVASSFVPCWPTPVRHTASLPLSLACCPECISAPSSPYWPQRSTWYAAITCGHAPLPNRA